MSKEQSKLNNPIWLSEQDACSLLEIKSETLRKNCKQDKYIYRIKKLKSGKEYQILLDSLSDRFQNKYAVLRGQSNEVIDLDTDLIIYNQAPDWAKEQADKYINILNASRGLKGKELQEFVKKWNEEKPHLKTSYSRINIARKKYEEGGVSALLAQYGKSSGNTCVPDKYFEYFKNQYLKEGAPSVYSCWLITLGYAMRVDGITRGQFPCEAGVRNSFPKHLSFKRRLEREIPKSSIYLARYGEAKWNRKYANYIERDYSDIECCSVWVSDHAQLDIACLTDDNRVVFPWITAWRDFKSSKWLGWILQENNPNSDHIFQSFYYAADEYGTPTDVIIDNGRDYRAKDFAGGRTRVKIPVDQEQATSMLVRLGVTPHFALPYNAQTKPIERDFLKIKNLLSKHMIGYRGGNVTERPEKLKKEIKQNKIHKFSELKEVFDDFIINVLNKLPSQGKNLKGKSPDKLFAEEFKEKRVVSRDALSLFCMRISRELTVTRNGVKDSELGIKYWADWMIGAKGKKVYLRRDPKNFSEAWVFSTYHEFLGQADIADIVPALARTEIQKEEFKRAIAEKNKFKKIEKAYAQAEDTDLNERILNMKAAVGSNDYTPNPRINRMANTEMDRVVRQSKDMNKIGTYDISAFIEEQPEKKKIYLFESELEEDLQEVGYGY